MSKKKKKVTVEKKPEAPKETMKRDDLALVAKASLVLKEKELVVKSLQELQKSKEELKASYAGLVKEFNDKEKARKFLDDEISAQGVALDNTKDRIKKEKEKEYAYIAKTQEELKQADADYKALLNVVKKKESELNALIGNERERIAGVEQENVRLLKHVDEVKREYRTKRVDVDKQQEELSDDKKSFDEYKNSLVDEVSDLEKAKVENLSIVKEAKLLKDKTDALMATFEHERAKQSSQVEAERSKIKEYELALHNQSKKLKDWEENLTDYDLKVKDRELQVKRLVQRYELEKKLK